MNICFVCHEKAKYYRCGNCHVHLLCEEHYTDWIFRGTSEESWYSRWASFEEKHKPYCLAISVELVE